MPDSSSNASVPLVIMNPAFLGNSISVANCDFQYDSNTNSTSLRAQTDGQNFFMTNRLLPTRRFAAMTFQCTGAMLLSAGTVEIAGNVTCDNNLTVTQSLTVGNGISSTGAISGVELQFTDGSAGNGLQDQNGVQILANQQAAVADAAGGAVIDVQARAQLNLLLAKLRAHGLIVT